MESDDSHNVLSDVGCFADPSMISLNPIDNSASRLTQKLSIITDNYSLDSTDYGSPMLSASIGETESASPSVDFDGCKKPKISYSTYLSGRAHEVAKRRQLIERLEKSRDKGMLMCTIPQLSELTITQLSMVLRRVLKASPGLREFVSDEVLRHIFDDFTTNQTSSIVENDKIHQFPDLPNEPDCLTDHETDLSSDEGDAETKPELPIKNSCQPEFYSVRRQLISSDRFASAVTWKLIEKQNKLKSFVTHEEFAHQPPPSTSDSKADSSTCVRCRPLIHKPKRKLFCVKLETQLLRSESPPAPIVVGDHGDVDLDFAHKDMPAINMTDKMSVEHVMQCYLYRLGTMPLHFSAKNHAAFSEIGKKNDFYGFLSHVQSELSNFPIQLKPMHSSASSAMKRRHECIAKVEEDNDFTDDANYPLLHKMKNEVVKKLKRHSNLLKANSSAPAVNFEKIEERVAPLKIKRSSVQLTSFTGADESSEKFANSFYNFNAHTSSTVQQSVDLVSPVLPQAEEVDSTASQEQTSQETNQTKSSSSSSSTSDSSSSSESESETEDQPLIEEQVQVESASVPATSAKETSVAYQGRVDSGDESDNESSSSSDNDSLDTNEQQNDENADIEQ